MAVNTLTSSWKAAFNSFLLSPLHFRTWLFMRCTTAANTSLHPQCMTLGPVVESRRVKHAQTGSCGLSPGLAVLAMEPKRAQQKTASKTNHGGEDAKATSNGHNTASSHISSMVASETPTERRRQNKKRLLNKGQV